MFWLIDFVIVLYHSGVFDTYYFVPSWLSLHVNVLVNVLDFVIVLFQSGVFKYVLVYSVWGAGGEGGCCEYIQNVFMYAEKTASGC